LGHGFQNTDEVSSYAYQMQCCKCLLHLSVIRKQIFDCDKLSV